MPLALSPMSAEAAAPVAAAEAPAVIAAPVAESSIPASSAPAPVEAASAEPAAAAAVVAVVAPKPMPAPSQLGKAEPFPHLYEYKTDTVEMDQKLGDVAIKEPDYTEAELALMEQLREAVAKMIVDPKQMACTAEDYPGGMHVHWTTHWPEGKGHALYTDNVSQLDADPARWPRHELIRFLRARNMDLKKATKMYFQFKRWRLTFGASHIASFPTAPWSANTRTRRASSSRQAHVRGSAHCRAGVTLSLTQGAFDQHDSERLLSQMGQAWPTDLHPKEWRD